MRKLISLLLFIALIPVVFGNQVDIGIFKSTTVPNKIEIRIRPDFNISSIQTLTGILYTVRWDDPTISITTQNIYPFFVAPQGSPVLYNGHYYQVFAAVPMIAMAMNANQEYLASSFTFTNGDCSTFEIIEDEWTQANNGNVYLELVGTEVTGIIYQANVLYGSFGGFIQGVDTIYLGNSTGSLVLFAYNGSILKWQRKINNGTWTDIPGTAGFTVYSEIPQTMEDYFYRVQIQYGTCPPAYSAEHHILVIGEISLNLTAFIEGAFQNGIMTTKLKDLNLIPFAQPYSLPPWNYNGQETVTVIPDNTVDWVLIELRETSGNASTATPDKRIAMRAGFLLKNGSIRDTDGTQNIEFVLNLQENLFVVIHHRNHISVISAEPLSVINGLCTFNFSSGESQALGGGEGHKELSTGFWGMAAGDANSNGIVDITDKQDFWENFSGYKGYSSSDFSLDSQINNKDKDDLWYKNLGFYSHVPE